MEDLNVRFYRSMYRIRRVEEEIIRIYPSDKIKSPVHLSIGQEAASVGVCEALKPQDVVFCHYRCHAHYLAKGGDLKKMMAELYGKSTGGNKGKGGSMHLCDVSAGVMGASAIVATPIPIAVGYAYGIKQLGIKDKIAVVFFGDGATEEGVFYESLNFAALKKLPILFVCEDNGYAIHTHVDKRQARFFKLVDRVRSFGVRAFSVGESAFDLREYTVGSREDLIRDSQPIFLLYQTYRWKEHVGVGDDFNLGYRTEEELDKWKGRDQLSKVALRINIDEIRKIHEEVDQEIAEAIEFAEQSPFPEKLELTSDVY